MRDTILGCELTSAPALQASPYFETGASAWAPWDDHDRVRFVQQTPAKLSTVQYSTQPLLGRSRQFVVPLCCFGLKSLSDWAGNM